MTAMRIHFDLTGYDDAHREVWTGRLAELAPGAAPDVTLAASADEADVIVETTGRQSFIGGRVFTVAPESNYHRRPESTFVWDAGDFPTGRLPGLYCSLDDGLFDPARHRGFCYPLRYNRHIRAFPLDEADRLFGFCGSPSSPLRHRLFAEFASLAAEGTAVLQNTTGLWGSLFAEESDARKTYADALRRSKFFLCPRGNGRSSIRLFETMEAARVPVILSDGLVLPQCVNWSRCAIIYPERNLSALPRLLREREPEWRQMAGDARREWERNFSDATLLRRVATELRTIMASRSQPESTRRFGQLRRVAPRYIWTGCKSLVRHGQQAIKRRHVR